MDEIFGNENFTNEIIWHYKTFQGQTHNYFPKKHDTLLLYSKSRQHVYNEQFDTEFEDTIDSKRWASYLNEKHQILGSNMPTQDSRFVRYLNKWIKENGRNPNPDDVIFEVLGQPIDTVWDMKGLDPKSLEKVGYPTQKPESLLERIIQASSNEGDLVADFFCGSGTTGAVAERLGRRWILSDISKTSVQVTRSRLVNQNSNPFVIENLGNYQRQLIYAKEVNLKQMYTIILKLFGAVPHPDMQGFGTSREDKSTLVYVCEPDRAMTAKKALDLSRMARAADGKGYRNLVILAWDYDYDFDDAYKKVSKGRDKELSDVEFKIIPSDVYKYLRSTKLGDPELAKKITFYQKPYIRIGEPEIASRNGKTTSVKIKIEQYVVMDLPLKDESKRPEIEKCLAKNFAYLIDYWTVDWDYNGDIFRSEWQAIRDKRGNQPVPVVAEKTLERGKRYTIAVRVVDVFGNDSSGTKEIDLR
jgi:DNA modification methylase